MKATAELWDLVRRWKETAEAFRGLAAHGDAFQLGLCAAELELALHSMEFESTCNRLATVAVDATTTAVVPVNKPELATN